MRSAFLYSLGHDLTPTLRVIGAVMFGAWTIAYGQIVLTCFRDKTYGLPLASICLNIAWEFIFSFNLVAPGEPALVWGNRLWFIVDCVIVLQVFLYGRPAQTNPWVRRHFYPITVASLAGELCRALLLHHLRQRYLRARDVLSHELRDEHPVHPNAVGAP